MSNTINIQGYLDTINAPWGKLFYDLVWHHMNWEGKKILDFGSGFGMTANVLAKKNEVVAIEPNEQMLEHRFCENDYEQIAGGIEKLKAMPNHTFDAIVCHNVLEYVEEREELMQEFQRVLKPTGLISIVKHNGAGKIMQKAVFEYNVDAALQLIRGEVAVSQNFGAIREYENCDLEQFCQGAFRIENVYGVRTFFGIQRNEWKTEPDWATKMYEIECAVEENPVFRDIAFFQHLLLRPVE